LILFIRLMKQKRKPLPMLLRRTWNELLQKLQLMSMVNLTILEWIPVMVDTVPLIVWLL
jgi:hypothetical protein